MSNGEGQLAVCEPNKDPEESHLIKYQQGAFDVVYGIRVDHGHW